MKLFIFVICFINIPVLWAQDLILPPKVDLLQYIDSDSPSVVATTRRARIWGWSADGKVAYSIEGPLNSETTFGIDFVIVDLHTNNVLFTVTLYPSRDDIWDEWSDGEVLFHRHRASLLDAMKTHGIVEQRTDFLPFPMRKNTIVFDANVIDFEYGEDEYYQLGSQVLRYSVSVTAGDNRYTKSIIHRSGWFFDAFVCGYFLSPFENRALIVIAGDLGQYLHGGVLYTLIGFHLEEGFHESKK